ncbi:hypothetical protein SAMN02910384_00112 [Pseudobutyrivibrio sp. ACV-2]|uniref:hypothetical protein n=1 Tax=Pseudobutyrivibrio sp. ACV-2 TaxID=1520801 RepID=UPI00089AEF0F|nr:hypothetical protein [Pseudobutyrivibrio sp. ACV-2]SDZ79157.1 hypothetical protein SAMN02910384_00112 [Pseudobutyrivibrio sp. ACV-2]
MKINRILLVTSVLCFSLLGTGCGDSLYQMSSEEEAIIALYSAKAVAKFNKNQITGIANARVRKGELDEEYKPSEEEEVAEAIEGEDNSEETETQIDPETGEPIIADDADEGAQAGQDGNSNGLSFTDAVGVDGVDFVCSEFDVSIEYKPTDSFILSRVNGKQYVILSIEASNTTEADVDFSGISKRTYSLSLNGGEKTNAVFTPLANDLANFKGKLGAGESKKFILVFLFSNSAVENISSLELFVTSDDSTRGTAI